MTNKIQEIIDISDRISENSLLLAEKITELDLSIASSSSGAFVFAFTIFILACFVGYFVVWKVTPALHTPLMAVTNAISSVIIVGAIIAFGSIKGFSIISVISFLAIVMASINIFGGFLITWRMLEMFKRK
jgi:NAD(P) transhydrogenase subunit alpha